MRFKATAAMALLGLLLAGPASGALVCAVRCAGQQPMQAGSHHAHAATNAEHHHAAMADHTRASAGQSASAIHQCSAAAPCLPSCSLASAVGRSREVTVPQGISHQLGSMSVNYDLGGEGASTVCPFPISPQPPGPSVSLTTVLRV